MAHFATDKKKQKIPYMKKVIYPVLIMLSITTMAVIDGCGMVRKPARFFAIGGGVFFILVILLLIEVSKSK